MSSKNGFVFVYTCHPQTLGLWPGATCEKCGFGSNATMDFKVQQLESWVSYVSLYLKVYKVRSHDFHRKMHE